MTQQEDQSMAKKSVLSWRVGIFVQKNGLPIFDVESWDSAFIHC